MQIQATLLALGATLAAAVQPLEVKGNYFVNPKTGNKFQMVGMAYQPGGSAGYNKESGEDPLTNPDICMRDAALMQILGVNTVRVYNLNPDSNHDECMSIFNAAGMYMVLDVNSPLVGEALTSYNPWESYYGAYLNRTFAVVEAFKDYPNTLAFFSGNEVINDMPSAKTVPPYMRAVTRDLKEYVAKHSSRPIPVGYSAADVRDVLFDSWHYFTCDLEGDDDNLSKADLFALNSYSWCGDSNFDRSGYDDLVSNFTDSSVPIFFSEFGCNEVKPRLFTEIGTIYGPEMTDVFSGGIVYEYTQEENNYGLLNISSDNSIDLLNDFYTLRDQYANVDFKKVQATKPPSSTPEPYKCDPKIIQDDGFNSNFTIPSLPEIDKIIKSGVTSKPKGKLVEIKDWNVKFEVRNPNGSVLKNLAVKPLDDDTANSMYCPFYLLTTGC